MRLIPLVLFLLAACGRSTEFDGGTAGGAGGGGGDAGFCNDLPDDSPTYFPGCPGSVGCSACGLQAGDGGVIVDGTYDVVANVLYESACGILESAPSRGTLEISNGSMQLVSTAPVALSTDTPTTRVNLDFTVDGGVLFYTPTCGYSGPISFSPYTSANGVLSLLGFPGLVGEPVFQKRP